MAKKATQSTQHQNQQAEKDQHAPSHNDDAILDIRQVAKLFGRSEITIRRWINEGLIQTVKLPNGLHKIRRSTVDAFLAGTAVTNPNKSIRLEELKSSQCG